jgi:hypothetical protein
MVPCCERTERQYLDKEGNVKPEWIEANYTKDAVVSIEEERDTDWGKYVFEKRGFYPVNTIVTVLGTPLKLCTCACHNEGSMVMH